jgi:spore coat polysaccharide biosynthesis protein SpsF (cytidylyltransferase family)
LTDPVIVDDVAALFDSGEYAYASNIEPRTYPDGLDVEVFSREVLEQVARTTQDPADREHVTTAIRRHPHEFSSAALVSAEDLGELRWTVDTAEDLNFLRKVVSRLGRRRYEAGMSEILAAIKDDPSLARYHGRRG